MAALVTRDDLIFGSGYITHNGGNFRFAEGGVSARFKVEQRDTTLDEFGRFDAVHTDRMVVVSGKLWAGWENLSLIFPSYFVAPTIGSRLKAVGVGDLPLVIYGANGDRMTVHNAMLTKMGNLFLGVNEDFFTADVEWTGLLAYDANPWDAAAYFTLLTGQAYSAPALDRTKFRAPVIKATWTGGTAGDTKPGKFATGFMTNKGWRLDFNPELSDEATKVDGMGTLNYTIKDFSATAKAQPIGPTLAEISAEFLMQDGFSLGTRISGSAADLTLTIAHVDSPAVPLSIVLYNSAIAADGSGFDWAREKNRIADVTWRTLPDGANARVSVT